MISKKQFSTNVHLYEKRQIRNFNISFYVFFCLSVSRLSKNISLRYMKVFYLPETCLVQHCVFSLATLRPFSTSCRYRIRQYEKGHFAPRTESKNTVTQRKFWSNDLSNTREALKHWFEDPCCSKQWLDNTCLRAGERTVSVFFVIKLFKHTNAWTIIWVSKNERN